jgi:hypothetical protein
MPRNLINGNNLWTELGTEYLLVWLGFLYKLGSGLRQCSCDGDTAPYTVLHWSLPGASARYRHPQISFFLGESTYLKFGRSTRMFCECQAPARSIYTPGSDVDDIMTVDAAKY